jgi:hypothetical protein
MDCPRAAWVVPVIGRRFPGAKPQVAIRRLPSKACDREDGESRSLIRNATWPERERKSSACSRCLFLNAFVGDTAREDGRSASKSVRLHPQNARVFTLRADQDRRSGRYDCPYNQGDAFRPSRENRCRNRELPGRPVLKFAVA